MCDPILIKFEVEKTNDKDVGFYELPEWEIEVEFMPTQGEIVWIMGKCYRVTGVSHFFEAFCKPSYRIGLEEV